MFIFSGLKAQDGLMWGGGLSIHLPSGLFNNSSFTFKDAAGVGYGVNASTLWFFNPRLSLGTEFGYSYFPKNNSTWKTLNYGGLEANYQSVNLSANGSVYFSGEDVKPYFSPVFGLNYLRNMIDFTSNYAGSTNDASVTYISNTLQASMGIEGGVLIDVDKVVKIKAGLRFTFLPGMASVYHSETDITTNPHGKQNQWGLYLKIFFKSKRLK